MAEALIDGTGSGFFAKVNSANRLCTDTSGTAQIFDGAIGPATLDKSTYSTNTIEYEHHEIHAGGHYFLCGSSNVGIGDEFNLGVITPNGSKWMHTLFEVHAKGEANLQIWEAGSIGGTLIPAMNSNRNSPNVSLGSFFENPTVTDSGTRICYLHLGAGTKAGASLRASEELILKSGTSYIFMVTSEANTNHMSPKLLWYEHTDKTTQF